MRGSRAARFERVLQWACALATVPAVYFLLHWVAWRSLVADGWLHSWEHLTLLDRRLGVRLRPGFVGQLGDVPVTINADGMRSLTPHDQVAAKQRDELLVVSAGDSNTFGVLTSLQRTYSYLLQERLTRVLNRRVRVANLGVPGYSLVQSVQAIKSAEHLRPDVLVVVADSFNDRAFVGRPDSPQIFAVESRLARPYEFGKFVSYPVLYFHRKFSLLPRNRAATPPSFDALPMPRVPILEHRRQLLSLIRYANERNTRLVLLLTGDAIDSAKARTGLAAAQSGDWKLALDVFHPMHVEHAGWYLPAFHAFRAAEQAHEERMMAEIRALYTQHFSVDSDRYLSSSAFFADEYARMGQELLRRANVALVDVRDAFQRSSVHFADAAHYDEQGHEIVAEQVTNAIAALIEARNGSNASN